MNKLPLVILGVGLIVLGIWIFVITPYLLTDDNFLELTSQNVGMIQFADNVGEELSEPTKMIFDWKREVVSSQGNSAVIHTTYDYKDIVTDESFWTVELDENVNKITREYLDKEGYFTFPQNLEKRDYQVYDLGGAVMNYKFVEEKDFDGLNVYVFYGTETFDISDAYPDFSEQIWETYSATNYIEPLTGLEVYFEEEFTDYALIDEKKVIVLDAKDMSTDFSKELLINKAKDLKDLCMIYKIFIPVIIASIVGILFFSSILVGKIYSEKDKVKFLNKLNEQKNEIFAILSHELRTPLMPIMSYSEMLNSPKLGDLNDKQSTAVKNILKSSIQLDKIITELLEILKIRSHETKYKVETFNLSEKLEKIKNSYAEKFDDIEFVNSTPDNLFLSADEKKITSIMDKLIENSLDFVSGNGKIEIGAKKQDGKIMIFVQDNGTGIPKDKQELIFTPFYQSDMSVTREHQGIGLGLSICKAWIEDMGGKIWVTSESGKGSTFSFTIPDKS